MVNRRVYLAAFAAVLVIAGCAVYIAVRTDPSNLSGKSSPDHLDVLANDVPALDAAKGWLNSPPLTQADLHGKVVVYDFWTYSCVNCLRTLPHLRALYDRYRADGLVIVGIHSPEFDFEKDHGNVASAVTRLGVTWPVAFDDDMAIWNAFENQYWPAEYLVDRDGKLRQVHFGEGDYDQKEDEVRALLGVPPTSPRAGDSAGVAALTANQTPEIHFGTAFGGANCPTTTNEQVPVDECGLRGDWTVDGQGATSRDGGGQIVLHYRGSEVNIVASSTDAANLSAQLDGKPLPSITVQAPQLYNIVTNGPPDDHTLVLQPSAAGFEAYSFTFGS